MFVYVQDSQKKQSAYIHFCVRVKTQQKPTTAFMMVFLKIIDFFKKKKYIVGILRIPIYFCPKDSASLL